ncbi:hypothetical protein C7M84_021279 [Penaeus vannamei]|uniref:Uncharacterized protein n=1 Tax=Penaeus vannamei TaxID=6689 RepID=A0A3R7SH32_PENVA|nr:hypothetical protein C7M84_021279 [Penaeus vannamei]
MMSSFALFPFSSPAHPSSYLPFLCAPLRSLIAPAATSIFFYSSYFGYIVPSLLFDLSLLNLRLLLSLFTLPHPSPLPLLGAPSSSPSLPLTLKPPTLAAIHLCPSAAHCSSLPMPPLLSSPSPSTFPFLNSPHTLHLSHLDFFPLSSSRPKTPLHLPLSLHSLSPHPPSSSASHSLPLSHPLPTSARPFHHSPLSTPRPYPLSLLPPLRPPPQQPNEGVKSTNPLILYIVFSSPSLPIPHQTLFCFFFLDSPPLLSLLHNILRRLSSHISLSFSLFFLLLPFVSSPACFFILPLYLLPSATLQTPFLSLFSSSHITFRATRLFFALCSFFSSPLSLFSPLHFLSSLHSLVPPPTFSCQPPPLLPSPHLLTPASIPPSSLTPPLDLSTTPSSPLLTPSYTLQSLIPMRPPSSPSPPPLSPSLLHVVPSSLRGVYPPLRPLPHFSPSLLTPAALHPSPLPSFPHSLLLPILSLSSPLLTVSVSHRFLPSPTSPLLPQTQTPPPSHLSPLSHFHSHPPSLPPSRHPPPTSPSPSQPVLPLSLSLSLPSGTNEGVNCH